MIPNGNPSANREFIHSAFKLSWSKSCKEHKTYEHDEPCPYIFTALLNNLNIS